MKIDTSKLKSAVKISDDIKNKFIGFEARHRALQTSLEELLQAATKAHAHERELLEVEQREAWMEAIKGTNLAMTDGLSIDMDGGYIALADELEAAIASGLNAEGINVRKLAEEVLVEPVKVEVQGDPATIGKRINDFMAARVEPGLN